MDITKFANLEDCGFIAFCGGLRRWIEADPKASSADYEQSIICRQYDDNRQYIMSGKGAQKYTGGSYFQAGGNMNFLEIPPLSAKGRNR